MSGILYIVATPIGNLGDLSGRAIEVLKNVDAVVSEDTRRTRILLTRIGAKPRQISFHRHSPDDKICPIADLILEGKDLAYVTDAGTPGISDPGGALVAALQTACPRIKIIPIPGPSALTALLSVADFETSPFIFAGFLAKKGRLNQLKRYQKAGQEGRVKALVIYESPYRILKALEDIRQVFGNSRIVFGRELTKVFEELIFCQSSELSAELAKRKKIVGEITLIVKLN